MTAPLRCPLYLSISIWLRRFPSPTSVAHSNIHSFIRHTSFDVIVIISFQCSSFVTFCYCVTRHACYVVCTWMNSHSLCSSTIIAWIISYYGQIWLVTIISIAIVDSFSSLPSLSLCRALMLIAIPFIIDLFDIWLDLACFGLVSVCVHHSIFASFWRLSNFIIWWSSF